MPDPYQLLVGDARALLATLPGSSVHTIVTSPPYFGLRDYGADGQIGLEATPAAYVAALVDVFREARRVLRDDGTLWLNLGDSFAANRGYQVPHSLGGPKHSAAQAVGGRGQRAADYGVKPKDLLGIPWRVALALQDDGWTLRSDIVWHKPNPMPESVTDRPTRAHEYLFLLSKQPRYYYDHEAVKEPLSEGSARRIRQPTFARQTGGPKDYARTGQNANRSARRALERVASGGGRRNLRDVWTIATRPYRGAHFAVFPPDLVRPCIRAGTSEHGACASCGAPYRRVVGDAERVPGRGSGQAERRVGEAAAAAARTNTHLGSGVPWEPTARPTIGWQPTCACEAGGVEPCTVLDPFNGAGTTGLVALEEGRRYLGIELNPEYADLTRERLAPVAAQPILF